MSLFNIHIPINKGVSADSLIGVASTVSIDRDGERMSSNAINDMARKIKEKGVNLFENHEHGWENTLGVIKNAEVVDEKLMIDITLDDSMSNPKVASMMKKLERGIQLGLSVGGNVTSEKMEYDRNLGKKVKVIDGVDLYEISVVGIPSNPDGMLSLPMAIAKSAKCSKAYQNEFQVGQRVTYHNMEGEIVDMGMTSVKVRIKQPDGKFGGYYYEFWRLVDIDPIGPFLKSKCFIKRKSKGEMMKEENKIVPAAMAYISQEPMFNDPFVQANEKPINGGD